VLCTGSATCSERSCVISAAQLGGATAAQGRPQRPRVGYVAPAHACWLASHVDATRGCEVLA
jgi:hypothetical protein